MISDIVENLAGVGRQFQRFLVPALGVGVPLLRIENRPFQDQSAQIIRRARQNFVDVLLGRGNVTFGKLFSGLVQQSVDARFLADQVDG